jgi:hypothetical protein
MHPTASGPASPEHSLPTLLAGGSCSTCYRRSGPGWLTLWLVLVIGGLIGLGVVAGPWVPGAITAVTGLTVGGAATAKRLGRTGIEKPADPTPSPPLEPDPALEPPP